MPNTYEFDESRAGISDDCPLSETSTFLEYFMLFCTNAIIDIVVRETNNYFDYCKRATELTPYSRMHRWKDCDAKEIWLFLGLTLLMPLAKKHRLQDYWDAKDNLLHIPVFGRFMTRDRYLLLLRFLHFSNVENEDVSDRLRKIRPVYSLFKEAFSAYFRPFQKLAIDESLVLFKGRLAFKQYIPSKRHRFGIKLFVLCDAETGMVLDIVTYTGHGTDGVMRDDPLGVSGSVVKALLRPYLDSGHLLFTDNWYTSPSLALYLHDRATGLCGTVKPNRKNMPNFPQLRKGQVARRKCQPIMTMKWHDKRDVTLLTTFHKGNMVDTGKRDPMTREPVIKPDITQDYTLNMRLIDKADMLLGPVECIRKTIKWYKKLFFHLIDISMLNAYNMYLTKTGDRVAIRDFYYEVGRQLLIMHGEPVASIRGRTLGGPGAIDRLSASNWLTLHKLVPIPQTRTGQRGQRQCVVCMRGTRRPAKRTRTKWMCLECEVCLCVHPCYIEYHTHRDF